MADHGVRDFPSPLLPDQEVRRLLTEAIGALGAVGGAVGGAAGGGGAGGLGGGLGGRAGGRFGAKHFTKVYGAQRVVSIPFSPRTEQAVLEVLRSVLRRDEDALVGVMGSGAMNLSPVLVQVQWSPDEVALTAHALEGLIKQRAVPKALDRLEDVLQTLGA